MGQATIMHAIDMAWSKTNQTPYPHEAYLLLDDGVGNKPVSITIHVVRDLTRKNRAECNFQGSSREADTL